MPFNVHRNKQLLWNSGANYATQQVTMATQATGLPGGEDSHIKMTGVLVVPFRG